MAKATVRRRDEATITLELNEDEAFTLVHIMRLIGGDYGTARRHTDNIAAALKGALKPSAKQDFFYFNSNVVFGGTLHAKADSLRHLRQ